MKKYIYLFIFICSSCTTVRKSNSRFDGFNGMIIYRVSISYSGYNPQLASRQKQMGDTLKVYFKDDKYYMKYNGTDLIETWYDNNSGLQYNLIKDHDTLYVDNTKSSIDRLKESFAMNNTERILGRVCNSYSIKSDNGEAIYFYDSSLYIDPRRFCNHKFGFVDIYYKNCKAPYLKHIKTSGGYTITYEAVEINETMPPDSIFNIPGQLPIYSLINMHRP